MQVKVFKFGGASVKDAPAIENLYQIMRLYPDDTVVVVISAMGKTTNFLEKVLEAYHQRPEEVPALVDELQRQHEQVAEQLVPDPGSIVDSLRQLFRQLRERLSCAPSQNYDFDYDQIVSFGELLSTTLISGYLNIAGIPNTWLFLVGMVVLRSIRRVHTPPRVSIPRDSGVTSRRCRSTSWRLY